VILADEQEPLEPARPDVAEDRDAYARKIPWKWILPPVIGGLVAIIGWQVVQGSRVGQSQRQVLAEHSQLDGSRDVWHEFRDRIEGLALHAAETLPVETVVDERLRISALHKSPGIYLRFQRDAARDPRTLRQAITTTHADSIASCLGIGPVKGRELYERAAFLEPDWRAQVEQAQDGLVVDAYHDELEHRAERDLPFLREAIGADYLLVVIENGNDRAVDPVDVFLFTLGRTDELVLSARVQSRGLLIPARIELPGVEAPPRAPPLIDSPAQHDCSIAAQVKGLAGEPAMEFGSAAGLEPLRDVPGEDSASMDVPSEAGEPTPMTEPTDTAPTDTTAPSDPPPAMADPGAATAPADEPASATPM
jgi:hypothetical protein